MLVKPKYRFYQPNAHCPVGGESEACDPHDICVAMEEYVLDSEKRKKHGEEAKKTVQSYTWEKVLEQFIKRLKQEHEEREEEKA